MKTGRIHRAVIHASMDGFWLCDTETRLLEVNDAACHLSGYSREEMVGMRAADFEANETAAESMAHAEKIRKTGSDRFMSRHRRRDGTTINVEVSINLHDDGGTEYFIVFVRDISEHKRAEDELRGSEAKFRGLFENSAMAIFRTSPQGRVLAANQAFAEILGYGSPAEVMKEITDIGSQVYVRQEDRVAFARHLSENGRVKGYEVELRRKDGSIIFVSSDAYVVKDDAGDVLHYEGGFIDLTGRKLAEAALRESEEKFRLLFENSRSAVAVHELVLDDKGKPVDYVFLMANPAFTEHTGREVASHIGKRATELYPGLEKSGLIEVYGKVVLSGEPTSFEMYFEPTGRHYSISAYQVGCGRFAAVFENITARKEMEAKMRKSEARYRTLFAGSRDAIMTLSPPDWRFTDANAATCAMFGVGGVEEFTRLSPWEISPDVQPDGRRSDEKAREMLCDILHEGTKFFEWRHRRVSGEEFPATVLLSLVSDGDEQHVVATVRDVTRQKRDMEALRTASQRFRMAVESAKLGVWDWNIAGNEMVWDARMLEIYGLMPETFPGGVEAWQNGLHPDDRASTVALLGRVLAGEARWEDVRFRVVRPGGEVRHVKAYGTVVRDNRGAAVRMLGVNEDVTEQRAMRDALRESEARYRKLVVGSPVGIIVADAETRKFLHVNPAACAMFGYDGDEMVGRGIPDIYPAEMQAVAVSEFDGSVRDGVRSLEGMRCVRKDGTPMLADIHSMVLELDGQRCLVGFFTDVTDRKKMADALVLSERRAAVGQLSAGVAHEFNNVLAIVRNHAQGLLYGKEKLPARVSTALRTIDETTVRGAAITKSLMEYSRASDASSFVTVDFAEVVHEAAKLRRPEAERAGIEVREWSHGDTRVRGHRGQLLQVTLNLLVNAEHAIIETRRGGGTMEVSVVSHGSAVTLEVRDDGVGVADDTLHKVFTPFFTTKGSASRTNDGLPGHGLGLSVSEGIVRAMRGSISMRQNLDRGVTVSVSVPADDGTAESAPAEVGVSGLLAEGSARRVLVVDDDRAVRASLVNFLRERGHEVIEFRDADEALKDESCLRCDAALIDYLMPGTRGDEFARRVRQRSPGARVVLLTGLADGMAEANGQFKVIRKPYSLAEIVEALLTR